MAHPHVVNESSGEQSGQDRKETSGQRLTEIQLRKIEANRVEAVKRKQGKENDVEAVARETQAQHASAERPANKSKLKSENMKNEKRCQADDR